MFDRWVGAVTSGTGKVPAWTLATAPLALARPNDHVCVRATSFRAQAISLSPRLQLGDTPSHRQYQRMLAMAKRVQGRAVDRELPPADLLDVHDFIRFTLSTKARTAMLARRR
jgi:hypothetical protein